MDFQLRLDRTPESIARLALAGIRYDPFASFSFDLMHAEEFEKVWAAHLPVLEAEARRLQMPLPDPGDYRPKHWEPLAVIDTEW
jgi:hypothetical protein